MDIIFGSVSREQRDEKVKATERGKSVTVFLNPYLTAYLPQLWIMIYQALHLLHWETQRSSDEFTLSSNTSNSVFFSLVIQEEGGTKT